MEKEMGHYHTYTLTRKQDFCPKTFKEHTLLFDTNILQGL